MIMKIELLLPLENHFSLFFVLFRTVANVVLGSLKKIDIFKDK